MSILVADEAEIGFMHQCRGLQSLAGFLVRQAPRRKPTQFLVDEG